MDQRLAVLESLLNFGSMTATTRSLITLSLALTAAVTAQDYSSNIVGYATVTVAPGYNLLANPLNAGVTNGANEIMPILDGELILTYNGRGFDQVGYDSGFGGWVGGTDKRRHSRRCFILDKAFFSSTQPRQRQMSHSWVKLFPALRAPTVFFRRMATV